MINLKWDCEPKHNVPKGWKKNKWANEMTRFYNNLFNMQPGDYTIKKMILPGYNVVKYVTGYT